jgi:hypothetical protein
VRRQNAPERPRRQPAATPARGGAARRGEATSTSVPARCERAPTHRVAPRPARCSAPAPEPSRLVVQHPASAHRRSQARPRRPAPRGLTAPARRPRRPASPRPRTPAQVWVPAMTRAPARAQAPRHDPAAAGADRRSRSVLRRCECRGGRAAGSGPRPRSRRPGRRQRPPRPSCRAQRRPSRAGASSRRSRRPSGSSARDRRPEPGRRTRRRPQQARGRARRPRRRCRSHGAGLPRTHRTRPRTAAAPARRPARTSRRRRGRPPESRSPQRSRRRAHAASDTAFVTGGQLRSTLAGRLSGFSTIPHRECYGKPA